MTEMDKYKSLNDENSEVFTAQANTSNLDQLFQNWLKANWSGHEGEKNLNRDATALSNHRRVLKLLSLSAGFSGDLAITPISAIRLNPELISSRVLEGLKIEADLKGKPVPKVGLVNNMISIGRGLALYANLNTSKEIQSGYKLRKLLAKKRGEEYEEFPHSDWPETLKKDVEKYQDWLRASILSSSEAEYRPEDVSEDTIRVQRTSLGPYLLWRARHNLPNDRLVNLIKENEFSDYLNDVFSDKPGIKPKIGGYKAANARATALAMILRYLIATDQIDPVTGQLTPVLAVDRPDWNLNELRVRFEAYSTRKRAFYRLGKAIKKRGISLGRTISKRKPPNWTPKDMQNICEEGFSSAARRCHDRAASLEQFTRRRSAMIFGISAETPLRIRSLTLIDWNDLRKLPNGRWKICVPGSKLKIRTRGDVSNIYTMVYSEKTSRLIDTYRIFLADYFGDKFEKEIPYIFPAVDTINKRGRQATRSALSRSMTQLALELRGDLFSPHDARYIVATFVIHKMGAPGIMLAAKLLGDKPETILKYYVKELRDESEETGAYFLLIS